MIKHDPSEAYCTRCEKRLSGYNPGPLCYCCDTRQRRERFAIRARAIETGDERRERE